MTKITLNGRQYELNVEGAEAAGFLAEVPVRRPVRLTDIPNKSIFQYGYGYTNTNWYPNFYQMIDNTSRLCGQAVGFSLQSAAYPAFFDPNDTMVVYRYLRSEGSKIEWVESILE